MVLLPGSVFRRDDRSTVFRLPPDTRSLRSLIRDPVSTRFCLRRDEDREFEGATDLTSLRLPGRSARARRAATAWGRALSTAGRIEGCWALRSTLSMRVRSPSPIWRRPMSGDWRWSRRTTVMARLWAEK